MKKSGQATLICMIMAVVFFSGMALDATAKKGKIDGKAMYKANCKICHDKGSDAGEYTPMTLIMDQWERFYDEQYVDAHKDIKMPAEPEKPVTEAITPEVLESIKKFTIKHAADSEHPMTCG